MRDPTQAPYLHYERIIFYWLGRVGFSASGQTQESEVDLGLEARFFLKPFNIRISAAR